MIPVETRIIPGSNGKGFDIPVFGKKKKGSDKISEPVTLDEVIQALMGTNAKRKEEIGLSKILDLHEEWRPERWAVCQAYGRSQRYQSNCQYQ